jgi:hypothetical protein
VNIIRTVKNELATFAFIGVGHPIGHGLRRFERYKKKDACFYKCDRLVGDIFFDLFTAVSSKKAMW